MKRRMMIAAGLFVAIPGASGYAQDAWPNNDIQIVGDLPPLPSDLANFSNDPPAPYVEMQAVGTARPSDDEIELSYEILINAPFGIGVTPIDVAQYLLGVGNGI